MKQRVQSGERQRVLIRSFPPTTNGNYGGILQTWALQEVVSELGHDVYVDGTKASLMRERTFAGRCKTDLKRWLPSRLVPGSTVRERLKLATSCKLFEFTASHIRTVAMHDRYGMPIKRRHDEFDAFVVGSDQVWRPRTMNVVSNLFGEIPKDERPRFSYAASFGTDALELRGLEAERAREAAQCLTSISVRESAAIDVVKRNWGREATQHVDPTLLLDRDRYATVGGYETDLGTGGPLIDYVLDEGQVSRDVVARVEKLLGQTASPLMPSRPKTWARYGASPTSFEKMSVDKWLESIANAGFVVTDSFHGTVFAIINQRPFVAIRNSDRGAARFDSLLELVGLSRFLVTSAEEITPDLVSGTVNWTAVQDVLRHERSRTLAYLKDNLSHRP